MTTVENRQREILLLLVTIQLSLLVVLVPPLAPLFGVVVVLSLVGIGAVLVTEFAGLVDRYTWGGR